MARKFLTMDGNEAAAHAAYAPYRSPRCSPRLVLQVQFTARSLPAQ